MKYTVTYGFDCPAYGETDIEAESPEQAADIARTMFLNESLICGWEYEPSVGCENYRVVSIVDENRQTVDDGFDLPSSPKSEQEEFVVIPAEKFSELLDAARSLLANHIDTGTCYVDKDSCDIDECPTDEDGDHWYNDWWDLRQSLKEFK
jgi:hypothetical protein